MSQQTILFKQTIFPYRISIVIFDVTPEKNAKDPILPHLVPSFIHDSLPNSLRAIKFSLLSDLGLYILKYYT